MMQIATVRSHEIWLSGTPLFCRSVAGSALTPALALDYLGELSTDIEAVVVLDREGRVAAATGDDDERKESMRELFVALLDRAADAAPGEGVDQLPKFHANTMPDGSDTTPGLTPVRWKYEPSSQPCAARGRARATRPGARASRRAERAGGQRRRVVGAHGAGQCGSEGVPLPGL